MGNSVNLLNLIPQKFRDSQILIDYLAAIGDDLSSITSANKLYNIGNWLDLIDSLEDFFNPRIADAAYLKHLAALIGLKLLPEDTTSESILRSSIIEAIDWYKIKGTYQSLVVIGLINQVDFNIYDMYTDDYETFEKTEWFVGGENENPTDFPYISGYYKSPHFGLEVILNKVYDADAGIGAPYDHLWHSSYWTNIQSYVERTRPAHTVPHYTILLNPQTKENGEIVTVDGDIQTKASINWISEILYFDQNVIEGPSFGEGFFGSNLFGGGGGSSDWTFDSDVDSEGNSEITFDEPSNLTATNIDTWRLGTGNKGGSLDDSSWDDLEDTSPTEGTIDADNEVTIYNDRIEIDFTIPKTTVLSGVSELGIYIYGGTANERLAISSIFPDIYKSTDSELRILIIITRE